MLYEYSLSAQRENFYNITSQIREAIAKSGITSGAELTLEKQAVIKLLELDIPAKVAQSAVKKAIGKVTVGQPLATIAKKAFKIALNMDSENETTEAAPQTDDLRKPVINTVYDDLKQSGIIAPSEDEF